MRYDASAGKKLRTLTGHGLRVAALCWNDAVLTSGSKDGAIFHHDVPAGITNNLEAELHLLEMTHKCHILICINASFLASGTVSMRHF